MGSLKALQQWCRIQCENYNDVEIRDMSASFRDGLAFCAIIHRHRPDLVDFDSLSKENVYENNRLAFEVAEVELGIPALLDAEDMVSMKVPDRLSVITYVSQYYNFFNNKSQGGFTSFSKIFKVFHVINLTPFALSTTANPPSMKRLSTVSHNEPAQKRPSTPLEDKGVEPETGAEVAAAAKRSSLSSTCAACQKHVHLVQRFLIDGKLYHRNCFRCTECHSTLLPGSYKGNNSGALVCTHHLSRHAPASQNGRPDLSKKPEEVQPARTGRSAAPFPALSERDEAKTPSPVRSTSTETPADDSATATAVVTSKEESLGEEEEEPRPSSPPNPFDESDEEEDEGEIEEETQAEEASNGDLPPPSDGEAAEASRPVPAPRRVSEVTPPPRPVPRVRVSCTANSSPAGEHLKPPTPPKPRERSQSPGSGTHKLKDPPWLALVQSETKRKKAPPPPPPGVATPPNTGSLSSLQAEGSGPSTPPNPFEDEDDEVNEEGSDGGTAPPAVAATHPWYNITQTPDGAGSEVTPRTGSSSRSASPGSAKSKKRPAPRVPPQPPTGNQALSIESLSSSSDHSSSQLPLGGSSDQEQSFSKSVSEPSISSPGDNPSSSSSADLLNHSSQRSSPSALPPNASSAPATPQTSRNTGAKPPRPTTTPSPLTTQAPNKRFCKENPFNRKASPSNAKSENQPSKGPRPARPPAPGHGFPLIKRKVQSDQYIPVEDIHAELLQLEKQLDELEQRGVELEKKLRDTPNDEDEERLLVDWFTLIHDKHHLVRREAELVYTAKQQNLEERQADVEYELRYFHKDPDSDHQKKKGTKFKPIKVLKRLSQKGDAGKSHSPRKDKS
ncbi:hypothetical protein CCH79_00012775 [Gambusia affinis]|uniref:MICAL-like protein 1 n=1 Tax=Gambusia affinis TaxID=33528 RepID=A0A315V0W1_GAMAF|nr:hypothetical protein CCH79_00012775 [Gambusia affinis]